MGGAATISAALPTAANAIVDRETHVIGSWSVTITAAEPDLGSFDSLMSFHENGVFTESRRSYIPATPLGDLLGTSGHGAWSGSGRQYAAFLRVLLQRAPTSHGRPAGIENVRLAITRGRRLKRFSGTFESRIEDPEGIVYLTVHGTLAGVRIEV